MTSTKNTTITDLDHWSSLLHAHPPRPLLTHLNADTSWLLQLPYPSSAPRPPRRTHFNVLIDPWLQGPQSDVAWWFSTQWHVVAPGIATTADLNKTLREVEGRGLRKGEESSDESEASDEEISTHPASYIDVVTISHEFTDHCHRATLEELAPNTPVFASDVAAALIRSWNYFDKVITTPALGPGVHWSRLPVGALPPWIAIGRVITPGNSLYYHSAVLIAFDLHHHEPDATGDGEVVIYSPHGIQSDDLVGIRASGLNTLALLHGLHDVRIWMTKQLNLGAFNGVKAVAATGARYWVATHDEIKTGGGFIAPFLTRRRHTFKEAVRREHKLLEEAGEVLEYEFLELGSGDGFVLE